MRDQDRGRLRLTLARAPALVVPGELLELYLPRLGAHGALTWMVLRWLAQSRPGASGAGEDLVATVVRFTGLRPMEAIEALDRLLMYELVQREGERLLVLEPLERAAFLERFGQLELGPEGSSEGPEEGAQEGSCDASWEGSWGGSWDGSGEGSLEDSLAPVGAGNGRGRHEIAHAALPQAALSHAGLPPAGLSQAALSQVAATREPAAGVAAGDLPGGSRTGIKAGAGAAGDEQEPEEGCSSDLQALMDLYHRKIGMMGPTHHEKLRFWLQEKGMSPEVVAMAIEETLQADSRSTTRSPFNYLEAILRNWHNRGVRTFEDLRAKGLSTVLSGPGHDGSAARRRGEEGKAEAAKSDGPALPAGAPNAEAYRRVSPELVNKWKELYPDGYGSA